MGKRGRVGWNEGSIFICGGDLRPGPRGSDCPNDLHDYPLPRGYVDADEVAQQRLRRGWGNDRCPDCGLYGWTPGLRDLDAPRTPLEVAGG